MRLFTGEALVHKGATIPVLLGALFGLTAVFLTGCDRSETPVDSFGGAENGGFSFMGVGEETPLSTALRDHLRDRLGDGAVEPSSPVDLSVREPDFLSVHLPAVDALHHRLNAARGVRVEHDATRLTFRYARRRDLPFTFAEMVFDNRTRRPLMVRVKAPGENNSIIQTLHDKHGAPRRLPDGSGAEQPYLWEHNGNFLLLVPVQDRLGKGEIQLLIYFVNNLAALVTAETNERQAREETLRRAGDRAF